MLKGSPYILNFDDHKPIVRPDEKKRGPISLSQTTVTTVSTNAHSQSTDVQVGVKRKPEITLGKNHFPENHVIMIMINLRAKFQNLILQQRFLFTAFLILFCFFRFIEVLEIGCQLASRDLGEFSLQKKASGQTMKFSLVSEEKFMKRQGKNAIIKKCDMSRLEDEYDYDTESEQIYQSKTMLATDLHDAVEWFVIGDPLEVVGNFSI